MRKLVTVRNIDGVFPIPGADAIEAVMIGGWTCVTKKGEFKPDDKCLYFEIDSILPASNTLFSFLTEKSSKVHPTEVGELEGHRLRTIRLRGQLSQGLALPIPDWMRVGENLVVIEGFGTFPIEDDFSWVFGVEKYEAPVPAQLAGQVRGNFPSWIQKTDQERYQNMTEHNFVPGEYIAEEKLEGSSTTIYFDGETIGVCSRNVNLKLDQEGNSFVDAAKEYIVPTLQKLVESGAIGGKVVIQGELIGEGIQGNIYKLKGHRIHVFDVTLDGLKLNPVKRREFLMEYFPEVDVAPEPFAETFYFESADDPRIPELADGKSELANTAREGLVFKNIKDGWVSFKAVSNQYLLKEK